MSLKYLAHFDGLSGPQKICYDEKNELIFVADFGNDRIAVLGKDMSFIGEIGAGSLAMVQGVTMRGRNVVAVYNPRRIREYDPSGTLMASHPIAGSVQPQACAYFEPSGEVVVTDFTNHKLIALDAGYSLAGLVGTGVTGISSPGPDDFYQPKDVIYAEDQQVGPALFVADYQNKRVVRLVMSSRGSVGELIVDSSNSWIFEQGPTPPGGAPFRPTGLAYRARDEVLFCVDGYARVWLVDIRKKKVRQIFSNPGSAPGQLANTAGIALVGDDQLVITDYTNNRATLYSV